jgi:integral membrane protein
MILKYVPKTTDLGVSIGGALHGFVFLVYGATVLLIGINQRWPIGTILVGLVSAVVPYATIPFDLWADRTGRLDGAWRREAGADPRDQRMLDRLTRWLVRHPILLVVVGGLVVVAVFTALLVVGPPVPKG